MLASEKLAVAAHLHVLLRRKTGRVTDTEWMAQNAEYAAEIVRFARAKALEDGHPDLDEWAGKLEAAVLAHTALPPRPFAQAALQAMRGRPAMPAPAPAAAAAPLSEFPPETGFAESTLDPARPPKDPGTPRYVGGIR
ncbi:MULTISPECIES: hypothetical protein [Ramlibacter]|uniref:Uncharacterized protein n=1 Tax=Ramlibacter pinisoli TaxID=2682844 RepID=A0A6N8J176_9BURK|nr:MULTISPECIES: hypothetical protein [Ramlibacter]MBA2963050.1 hypothetical protein [Ramlibacter sp. CGMCC 1.13660]MVQ32994.1 hypothetical protein [Ramlibacter pinisoli]